MNALTFPRYPTPASDADLDALLANLDRSPVPTDAELAKVRAAVAQDARRLRTIAELTALKDACNTAITAAMNRRTFSLFDTWEGHAVVNAAHDLTECDALYDLAGEIERAAPVDCVQ